MREFEERSGNRNVDFAVIHNRRTRNRGAIEVHDGSARKTRTENLHVSQIRG